MLNRRWAIMLVGAVVCCLASAALIAQTAPAKQAAQAALAAAAKGPRPELFKYPPLGFKPPKGADFRATLSNGLVVYLAEDHEIPWFEATIISPVITGGGGGGGRGRGAEYGARQAFADLPQRGGGGGGGSRSFLEPPDKLGLQSMVGSLVRSGGTTSMTADQINERMDFLAGTVTATGLSIHMRHLDEGLKIWLDLLTNPAFPDDRLQREKQAMLPAIRNRNRNIGTVATRTFQRLVYGDDSPIVAEPTEATIGSIARADLVAWHKKYWGANNAILIVAGDFKKAEMLQKLEATFGKWRAAEKAVPRFPKADQTTKPGVYMVQPQGVTPNQGIIYIGHIGIMRDDPDYPAVDLMNYTLGGGSFSSRITKIVRTDNGLAYSTSSSFPSEIHYPGTFQAFCQTKNETVVFAAQLMLNEIERMRAGEVTEQDLKFAKAARLSAFPAMFSNTAGNLRNFASLELEGRPRDFYDTYESRYAAVTLADIKRVAQKYLRPDKLVVLVAGNVEECKAGAGKMLPNQPTIDAMAAKYGGRTIDGIAKRFGDGTVRTVALK